MTLPLETWSHHTPRTTRDGVRQSFSETRSYQQAEDSLIPPASWLDVVEIRWHKDGEDQARPSTSREACHSNKNIKQGNSAITDSIWALPLISLSALPFLDRGLNGDVTLGCASQGPLMVSSWGSGWVGVAKSLPLSPC